MSLDETVELVFSGKSFPDVPKSVLINNSGYFRGLLSGKFRDSSKSRYVYPDLPPSGFELLLSYMKTQQVNFKGMKIQVIEKALIIADVFCVDSFESSLKSLLFVSWPNLELGYATSVAKLIHVDQELLKAICEQTSKALDVERNISGVNDSYNYDSLILATSKSSFWDGKGRFDDCSDFFDWFYERVLNAFLLSLRQPPNLKKMRALVPNLKLESMPWNNLKLLFNRSIAEESVTKKCALLACQHYFNELRHEILRRISCIRVCYVHWGYHKNQYGLMEFNLSTWSWETKFESMSSFPAQFCAFSRDHINIFGEEGLMYRRTKHPHPKYFRNIYITELVENIGAYPGQSNKLVTCVVGRSIFMYAQDLINWSREIPIWYREPILFKWDVFNHDFDVCATFEIRRGKMVARGRVLYIAGFSTDESDTFVVQSYHTVSGEIKTVAIKKLVEEDCVDHVVMRNKILYVFFSPPYNRYYHRYLVVNTGVSSDQILELRVLESFFTRGWRYDILQVCATKDGVMCLIIIRHNCHHPDFLGLKLVHLDPESNVFLPLGFLPNPTEPRKWTNLTDNMKFLSIQMESTKPCSQFETFTNGFPEGLEDLKNPPHKNSSWYY